MKIIIKSINLNLSDREKQVIEEKISKLNQFLNIFDQGEEKGLNPPAEIEVIISKETNHHLKGPIFKSAITMFLPGKNLRVEAQAESIDKAFQESKEEAEREVKKYKNKNKSKFKRSMLRIKRILRRP
ncbi:MAG: HPF/RaiA family ribosome-associated protein [Candidatus Pacebacteria bacterium]|nr:HPF/RaiA family ribosome-associated protein [Candidatus Paceibacterota bacterium]